MGTGGTRQPASRLGGERTEETGIPSLGDLGLDNFVPYLINRISARWQSELAEDLKDFNLTTPQMRALAVLGVSDGLTMNELSVLAVTEQSTMSRTIDSLEERGLVRRQQRPSDMRVREVGITAEGRKAFDRFWPTMFRRSRRLFRGINDRDRTHFIATLRRILQNVDPEEGPSD
jgi:DNA-binding MarR family transcriptional regulator